MYDLLLPKRVRTLDLGVHDDWCTGIALDEPPQRIVATCGTEHPPLLLCSRTPLFHRDIVEALRAMGAGNLQAVPVTLQAPRQQHDAWFAVNVVGRLSLAAFAARLPAADSVEERRQPFVREAMTQAAAPLARIAHAARPQEPHPAPAIVRLAEGEHPLLIRSDVRTALDARFNVQRTGSAHQVRFDDLRFCDLYMAASFQQLASEAAARIG